MPESGVTKHNYLFCQFINPARGHEGDRCDCFDTPSQRRTTLAKQRLARLQANREINRASTSTDTESAVASDPAVTRNAMILDDFLELVKISLNRRSIKGSSTFWIKSRWLCQDDLRMSSKKAVDPVSTWLLPTHELDSLFNSALANWMSCCTKVFKPCNKNRFLFRRDKLLMPMRLVSWFCMTLETIAKCGIIDRVATSSSSNIRFTPGICFEFSIELFTSSLNGYLNLWC